MKAEMMMVGIILFLTFAMVVVLVSEMPDPLERTNMTTEQQARVDSMIFNMVLPLYRYEGENNGNTEP